MNVIQADITNLPNIDIIVNAANTSLVGGGGVDGAIHRAAGPLLYQECLSLNGCPTGNAKYTKAYNLPNKYIIHTVGPIYKDGLSNEDLILQQCYINTLNLALALKDCKSIAFPCISTGVYGYPNLEAACIAIKTCYSFRNLIDITFCCFLDKDFNIYTMGVHNYEA